VLQEGVARLGGETIMETISWQLIRARDKNV